METLPFGAPPTGFPRGCQGFVPEGTSSLGDKGPPPEGPGWSSWAGKVVAAFVEGAWGWLVSLSKWCGLLRLTLTQQNWLYLVSSSRH